MLYSVNSFYLSVLSLNICFVVFECQLYARAAVVVGFQLLVPFIRAYGGDHSQ